jgi:hypothetical protein
MYKAIEFIMELGNAEITSRFESVFPIRNCMVKSRLFELWIEFFDPRRVSAVLSFMEPPEDPFPEMGKKKRYALKLDRTLRDLFELAGFDTKSYEKKDGHLSETGILDVEVAHHLIKALETNEVCLARFPAEETEPKAKGRVPLPRVIAEGILVGLELFKSTNELDRLKEFLIPGGELEKILLSLGTSEESIERLIYSRNSKESKEWAVTMKQTLERMVLSRELKSDVKSFEGLGEQLANLRARIAETAKSLSLVSLTD